MSPICALRSSHNGAYRLASSTPTIGSVRSVRAAVYYLSNGTLGSYAW